MYKKEYRTGAFFSEFMREKDTEPTEEDDASVDIVSKFKKTFGDVGRT